MEPLPHLGRTLASIRSIGALSLEEAATGAGVSVAALRDAERGLVAPTVVEALAGFYGLDARALAGGQATPASNGEVPATVFLLHGASQDFDSTDWTMLNRALQFGRLFVTHASRAGLAERQSFVPVPPVGPMPRDAAIQGYRLARQVRSHLQLGGHPLGDLRDLIETRLGIVVLVEPFETLDLRAASIIDVTRMGAAIVLSAEDNERNRNPVLNRVYLAHELCHVLFDPGAPGRVQIALDDKPQGQFSEESLLESRAKGFAAELLLPKDGLEPLLGAPRGEETSVVQARGLTEQAAEQFRTPWTLTVWHLKNMKFMSERVANELIQEKRRAEKRKAAQDNTTLPKSGTGSRALPAVKIPTVTPDVPPDFVRDARRVGGEFATAWADKVLDKVYAAIEGERPLEATDVLVEQLDAMLSAGDDVRARRLLDRLDFNRLRPEVLTALLPQASHGHGVLGETWPDFRERALRALAERWQFTPDRCRRLLERLG